MHYLVKVQMFKSLNRWQHTRITFIGIFYTHNNYYQIKYFQKKLNYFMINIKNKLLYIKAI
jgi:hypothetical protein